MKFHYRYGYPFWQLAAKLGIPVTIRVDIKQDAESGSYWANSPDLDGLVVAGQTLDELRSEVISAAILLMEEQGSSKTPLRGIQADMHLASSLGGA